MRKDIDLTFAKHPITGDLASKVDESAVKQSLKNLIMTNFYERGFNVDFGTNVTYQLFENVDNMTIVTLKNSIINAVENYEPDVDLMDVHVSERDDNSLDVKLLFHVFNTREEQELVVRVSKIR